VRSCLVFAVSVSGRELTTVEGIAAEDGTLHPVQQALQDHHGLQCGFCTPGFVMTACGFLAETPDPDEDEIREGMAGQPVPLHRLHRDPRRGEAGRGGAARDRRRPPCPPRRRNPRPPRG
jgi:hypothetical protein